MIVTLPEWSALPILCGLALLSLATLWWIRRGLGVRRLRVADLLREDSPDRPEVD